MDEYLPHAVLALYPQVARGRARGSECGPHPRQTRGEGPCIRPGRRSARNVATYPIRSPPRRRSRRIPPAADNPPQWWRISPAGQRSTPFRGDPLPPPRRQHEESRSLPDRQGPRPQPGASHPSERMRPKQRPNTNDQPGRYPRRSRGPGCRP